MQMPYLLRSKLSGNGEAAYNTSCFPIIKNLFQYSPPQVQNSKITTPLGSLWKLFVYVYLVDRGQSIPDYVCSGSKSGEEAFCCDSPESIGADEALIRSCSPFFEPERLNITPREWQAYWQPLAPPSARWLTDLKQLRPATTVTVHSLLDALSAIPSRPRYQAERALTSLLFTSRAEGILANLGGRLHVKTWTWDNPSGNGLRVGGFAGWLADGTPLWVRGDGSSGQVIRRNAATLSHWLDTLPWQQEENECVMVRFFAAYPLKQVIDMETGHPVKPGILNGRFRVAFKNGNYIKIRSRGELSLSREEKGLRIKGRLGLNEYIARVLDREAAAEPKEAAKALAIAIRTYLMQNAVYLKGCYHIDDSSRAQRVSPNPPSESAQRIAIWTDSLIIKGASVQYHSNQPGANRLAWTQAVALAQEKQTFDTILKNAYKGISFASMYGGAENTCERMQNVEDWLKTHSLRWQRILAGEPGFEIPSRNITACHLKYGNPYFDYNRKRIYVRGLLTVNDRITIAHEYAHMGFRFHPKGTDEIFLEKTARRLIGE